MDTEALKQSSEHFTAQMAAIEKKFTNWPVKNSISLSQTGRRDTIRQTKIVDKARKTKTGQYVTSEEVLESLRHKHPVVEKILEHRGLKNYWVPIDALPLLINPRTGRGILLQSNGYGYRTSQFQ